MCSDERRALEGGNVEEWLVAADLSLVAPEPPAPALLKLFLTAVENTPPGTTNNTHVTTMFNPLLVAYTIVI